jgi:hypothetical protein
MTKPLAVLVAAAVLSAPSGRADEHLLSARDAEKRLVETADARGRDLAAVSAFVGAAEVTATLEAAGLDPARVQASLAALDDQELREIAARVAALDGDPVAGAAFTGKQVGLLAGFLLILIFVLIIA